MPLCWGCHTHVMHAATLGTGNLTGPWSRVAFPVPGDHGAGRQMADLEGTLGSQRAGVFIVTDVENLEWHESNDMREMNGHRTLKRQVYREPTPKACRWGVGVPVHL